MSNLQHLPAGWQVTNSSGSWSAPAESDDINDDDAQSGDGGLEAEDLRPDSPGWEDVEDDVEPLSLTCLLCSKIVDQPRSLVDHLQTEHEFDLDSIRKQHNLDFLGTIKLVNYVRHAVANGQAVPDVSKAELWADDKFMQPTMDDDAVLYSIDDLRDPNDASDPLGTAEAESEAAPSAGERELVSRALKD